MGAASQRVAAIEVEQAGRKWLVTIDSPCGAFVVGVESVEPATLRAVDEYGDALTGGHDLPSTASWFG